MPKLQKQAPKPKPALGCNSHMWWKVPFKQLVMHNIDDEVRNSYIEGELYHPRWGDILINLGRCIRVYGGMDVLMRWYDFSVPYVLVGKGWGDYETSVVFLMPSPPPPPLPAATVVTVHTGVTYLKVPLEQKENAKQLGAMWDWNLRLWFTLPTNANHGVLQSYYPLGATTPHPHPLIVPTLDLELPVAPPSPSLPPPQSRPPSRGCVVVLPTAPSVIAVPRTSLHLAS